MKKILVIGGTQFIGRHVVQKLLENNYSVTLLNRGQTNKNLFPELSLIKVDRASRELFNSPGLKQDFDAVIDLSAYYPRDVKNILDIIRGRAGRYILCSTISVYSDDQQHMFNESSKLKTCDETQAVAPGMAFYGEKKAECERVALAQHHDGIPTVILRPSIVYGEHDHTDRMAYWIYKAANKMPFVLPDDGLNITQKTYAPDLAAAFVRCVSMDQALGHAYNIAETELVSLRNLLVELGNYLGTKPLEYAVSCSSDYLLSCNIKPWVDLPLWLSRSSLLIDTFKSRQSLSLVGTPNQKALAKSADVFLSRNTPPKAGLTLAQERMLTRQN